MTFATVGDYARQVALRINAERIVLAGRWLYRLKELVMVAPNDVFPSQQLLDHIPTLIGEIAAYVDAPEAEEIAANTAVIDKARELGVLRHSQQASVHQLLREYEILSEILEAFVVDETQRLGLAPSWPDCVEVFQRLTKAARTLMRTTVDTFVSAYTTTIQERNARLRNFSQFASHELRSPIGAVLFAVDALDRESDERSLAERFRLLARTARNSAERMAKIVEDVQRVVRLDEPLDVPSEQEIDLGGLAVEVARQLSDMAAVRGVRIDVAPGLPVLHTDPARVELALINLISNAIKYSDPSKTDAFVEIGPIPTESNPEMVSFQVRDNGVGMGEECRAAIVTRLGHPQAEMDSLLRVPDDGLGLAIVVECIRALGGTLRVDSAPQEGTTFVLTVPRAAPTVPSNR